MPFSGKQNRQPVPIGIDPTDFDQATSSYTNLIDHCDDITNNEEHWSTPSTLRRKLVPGLPVPVTHGVQFSVRSDERPVKLQHTPCRKIIMAVVLAILPAPFFVTVASRGISTANMLMSGTIYFTSNCLTSGRKYFEISMNRVLIS